MVQAKRSIHDLIYVLQDQMQLEAKYRKPPNRRTLEGCQHLKKRKNCNYKKIVVRKIDYQLTFLG